MGRGPIRGILTFLCDDHYRLSNATWVRELYFLAAWWAKLAKNDDVRHNMTQIACLLAVATVFVDLWISGEGLIHQTKLPLQELELKMQERLMREGGA